MEMQIINFIVLVSHLNINEIFIVHRTPPFLLLDTPNLAPCLAPSGLGHHADLDVSAGEDWLCACQHRGSWEQRPLVVTVSKMVKIQMFAQKWIWISGFCSWFIQPTVVRSLHVCQPSLWLISSPSCLSPSPNDHPVPLTTVDIKLLYRLTGQAHFRTTGLNLETLKAFQRKC